MENTQLRLHSQPFYTQEINAESDEKPVSKSFILGNTSPVSLNELQNDHIIPVFTISNTPLISQAEFITATEEVVHDMYRAEKILQPQIRISHPVKGRIPSARSKPSHLLEDHEKTIYYERMMFVIEVPTITSKVNSHTLNLTIGGVKSYSFDNLHSRRGSAEETFKIFVGFSNQVCLNMCLRSDGYIGDLKVRNIDELQAAIRSLIYTYNQDFHLKNLQQFDEYVLDDHRFALLMGRSRLYQHLPASKKKNIPELLLGDQQLGAVCKDYYADRNFCRDNITGNISLWNFYNLCTGAMKTTYIDQFLDRSVNTFDFTSQIKDALDGKSTSWFLS